ncbi:MAG: GvpL/GvpF family gas vesicle protein [Candidatus Omnitrophica bacterium]|nr:GvpL/GvpF family gas vesicle protein [Candidatus Omnitrophota bacterium]
MGELVQLYGFVEYGGGDFRFPASHLFLIPYLDIACLARRVSEEEFAQGALQERLKDTKWLKVQLMEQEEALERIMKACTVVPLKWGALFRTVEAAQGMLKERYETVRELLKKLKGREEWTVRASVDRGRLQEAAALEDPEIQRLRATIEKMPPGTAYLLTERLKLLTEEVGQRTIDAMLQEFFAHMMRYAEASTTAEPVRGADDPEDKELIFQMAFLVPQERVPGFTQAVLQEARQRHAQGFEIQQVGPFPPYYFCNLELKGAQAHD